MTDNSILQRTVSQIKNIADVEISIFDVNGVLLAKNDNVEHSFIKCDAELYQDEHSNQTALRYSEYGQNLVLVTSGTDASSISLLKMLTLILDDNFGRLNETLSKTEIIKSILSGKYTGLDIEYLKEKYRIEDGDYYMLVMNTGGENTDGVINYLTALSTSVNDIVAEVEPGIIVFIKYCVEDDGINSALSFANIIIRNAATELNVSLKICVGNLAHGAQDFFESFNQARNGLRTGAKLAYGKDAFSFKEFLLPDILLKLPASTVQKFKNEYIDEGLAQVLNDETLIETAEMFMSESLNVSETARAMYVHRNTLMYRLDKIEKETGLNIRNFIDAVTFRISELISKL